MVCLVVDVLWSICFWLDYGESSLWVVSRFVVCAVWWLLLSVTGGVVALLQAGELCWGRCGVCCCGCPVHLWLCCGGAVVLVVV